MKMGITKNSSEDFGENLLIAEKSIKENAFFQKVSSMIESMQPLISQNILILNSSFPKASVKYFAPLLSYNFLSSTAALPTANSTLPIVPLTTCICGQILHHVAQIFKYGTH